MIHKRLLREGSGEGCERQTKRLHLNSTPIFKGLNRGRILQDSLPCLEPMIRKWVQEAVDQAIDSFPRSSNAKVESNISRTLQLQFRSILPPSLFTGSKLVSKDTSPIEVALYDSTSKRIVTSGPLSSMKVSIVVLDGDFEADDREDWTGQEFDSKIVKNREGKKPLLTGELAVVLKDGVGHIGDLVITDNSSWSRSGKFMLGAKVANSNEMGIREARSNAFKVKDHRGESYKKHHPPSLDDELWRLEKIAKDGKHHKKLTQIGINSVRDFLRGYFTDQDSLRAVLSNVSTKTWEAIITHATKCTLDDKVFLYRTAEGTGLFFNSVYELVAVTFDGDTQHPINSLNIFQKRRVDNLKQLAYKNLKDWVLVCEHSINRDPMLLPNLSVDTSANSNLGLGHANFQEQGQHGRNIIADHRAISPPTNEEEQNYRSFNFGESSNPMQAFNPTFRNSFGMNNSLDGSYIGGHHQWASGGNCLGLELSTDYLPIVDNFQVETFPSCQGVVPSLNPNGNETAAFPSTPGIFIRGNGTSKSSCCKVPAWLSDIPI